MINWEKAEQVLETYCGCYRPGDTGETYFLYDEGFYGFTLQGDRIEFFDYAGCDFFKNAVVGEEVWSYWMPKTFRGLLDLLFKREFLYPDDSGHRELTIEETKEKLNRQYAYEKNEEKIK